MLINFEKLIQQYRMSITGVIHVGAHWGQEYDAYIKNGIQHCIFIEPCAAAFNVLKARLNDALNVVLFNCACGEKDCHQTMYTSPDNQGMSNSLLKPKRHIDHYPTIKFQDEEVVPVRKLDNLPFTRGRYNLLMMDTQGTELKVLKGASHTLKFIDYIYTEVNSQELYEGNAFVHELDSHLKDFQKVTEHWVPGKGWGDAVYIRKTMLHDQRQAIQAIS